MSISFIHTSAPGKVVVSGEYAVLIGAPAIAMAVNRRARCSIQIMQDGHWSIRSQPSFSDADLTLADMDTSKSGDWVCAVLNRMGKTISLPAHAKVALDTKALFSHGKKMGLGSSAASLVSLYAAVCALGHESPSVEGALRLHDDVHASGSGIDVATSYKGGTIRFQDRHVKPMILPSGVETRVFFVGTSTTTRDRVQMFQHWLSTQPESTVDRIKDASTSVVNSDLREEFLDALRYFIEILEFIDNGSRIGIWGPQHRAMKSLANRDGILYKPSGAGGGDIGLAMSTDTQALDWLVSEAEKLGLQDVDVQREDSGVRIESME